MKKTVRLVIGDSTELIRRAVTHVIKDCCPGVEVVGEATDYAELFRVTKEINPDVVLIDMNMPCDTKVEATRIRAELSSCCVLVMSALFDDTTKTRALECGASDSLDKSNLAQVLPAVEQCLTLRSKAAAR